MRGKLHNFLEYFKLKFQFLLFKYYRNEDNNCCNPVNAIC